LAPLFQSGTLLRRDLVNLPVKREFRGVDGVHCDRLGNYCVERLNRCTVPAMKLSSLRQRLGKTINGTPDFGKEELAYRRLVEKGFAPDAVIDVGAYEGEWTRLARKIFGDIPSLMVEAQAAKKPILDRVCADLPLAEHVSAALSRTSGETITFYEMDTGSSFLAEQSNAPRTETKLTTRTLDEVAAHIPGSSLFLKIDVQGAELHVLAGGHRTLARSAVVQLEVAMLPYNKGAPTILEVLSYMDERDFVPFDISGESRLKGHLVQIDLLFTPRDSILRPNFIMF
jgi:FkbM family methyltransferase